MAVERAAGGTSLIDVLDRVLDKGIVIDAWVRVSLVGIDLITVEARVVVASIDTYLKYSEAGRPVRARGAPRARVAAVRRAGSGEPGPSRRAERPAGGRAGACAAPPPRCPARLNIIDGSRVRGGGNAIFRGSRRKAGAA
jgi:hypothetical protein